MGKCYQQRIRVCISLRKKCSLPTLHCVWIWLKNHSTVGKNFLATAVAVEHRPCVWIWVLSDQGHISFHTVCIRSFTVSFPTPNHGAFSINQHTFLPVGKCSSLTGLRYLFTGFLNLHQLVSTLWSHLVHDPNFISIHLDTLVLCEFGGIFNPIFHHNLICLHLDDSYSRNWDLVFSECDIRSQSISFCCGLVLCIHFVSQCSAAESS